MSKRCLWVGILVIAASFSTGGWADSGESMVAGSEGIACKDAGLSSEQLTGKAEANAIENARKNILSHISAQEIEDKTKSRLMQVYSSAPINILQKDTLWLEGGRCVKIVIRTEAVPAEAPKVGTRGAQVVAKSLPYDGPRQLLLQVWADRQQYRRGERIRLYVRGNKAFHARIVYRDAAGRVIQLLPNPYRQESTFGAGTVYEIPSPHDRFDLEVTEPFGTEQVIVYGSTLPLGDVEVVPSGSVYQVMTAFADIGTRTRGIAGTRPGIRPPQPVAKGIQFEKSKPTQAANINAVAEFSEASVVIQTLP